jgi:metallo-beta-lactamase family protein
MILHFLGANRQVTGSRYLLEAAGKRVMIDCGMFQERSHLARNWEPSPGPPDTIDVMLLTHAHLDHVGLVPKLVRDGFGGHVHATPPSIDLAAIVLQDSARIQEEDAAYKRRRHRREGRRGPHEPAALYTPEDAELALKRFRQVHYGKPLDLAPGLQVRYHDAGHIIGSAMLEITVGEGAKVRRLVMSGDIGTWDRPLMEDPTLFSGADAVVMESTYGNRDHEGERDVASVLERVINETVQRGGNVVVPTFAIDRAQELMYHLSRLTHEARIPRLTVFLDSPMAIGATTVYKRYRHLLDDGTQDMLEAGRHPFQFPGLHFSRRADESRAINSIRGSCVILAGSGMCTGGRIKHHLRQNIEHPESTILFVGYQAEGTLGRHILRGEERVRIHGRTYQVRARVERLNGLSAHADRSDLLRWLGALQSPPERVFLTHGEMKAATALADDIRESHGWSVEIPEYGEVVEL